MILFVEPFSKNIDMYVPAFPLPILEIASFIKSRQPEVELEVISLPVDYGLPLFKEGKEAIYRSFLKDLDTLKPRGIGISCTAIAQAEGVIELCDRIKAYDPDIFLFLGGYFPTIYHHEILARTSAVDLIVLGEGEESALKIVECIERGQDPRSTAIPSLVWMEDGKAVFTERAGRFDLRNKALLNLGLLRYPRAYDILPYSFSRGCPYNCSFCMEEFIRPVRKEVPQEIVRADLRALVKQGGTHNLLVSDALFRSFDLFPLLRSLGVKVNFETRCDVLKPDIIPEIADVCGIIALGFESASFNSLKRMNKVKDRAHYERYVSNAARIFQEAVRSGVPVMVFMIAGYPGDHEEDLKESLEFVQKLSENKGSGGYVFKIGECRLYPKTPIYEQAKSSPDVQFDDHGVFGDNIVRWPSADLRFETVLRYMEDIFRLSEPTPKFDKLILDMMPFFRLPADALTDSVLPQSCFMGPDRSIIDVKRESLATFREKVPLLKEKYQKGMSGERKTRELQI